MPIKTVIFDIGGVLLTNGWDKSQREKIVGEKFGLNIEEFEAKHQLVKEKLDDGSLNLSDYLDTTIFDLPRSFDKSDFLEGMKSVSQPFPEMLSMARTIRASGEYPVYSINNECRELHEYRYRTFDLGSIFQVCFCSGFMGCSKPYPPIYRNALGMLAADPKGIVFIDDREKNLPAAQALGMTVIHHQAFEKTKAELTRLLPNVAL